MSLDVKLYRGEELAKVEPHLEGGTICDHKVGNSGNLYYGSGEAVLNITYNYNNLYKTWLDKDEGIRWLHGKKAGSTIERLEMGVTILGTERDSDYWKATPGNAGYALSILLDWAKKHPDAHWKTLG